MSQLLEHSALRGMFSSVRAATEFGNAVRVVLKAGSSGALYAEAQADPEAFWAKQAENLDWFQKWDKVLDTSSPPFYTQCSSNTLVARRFWPRSPANGRCVRCARTS